MTKFGQRNISKTKERERVREREGKFRTFSRDAKSDADCERERGREQPKHALLFIVEENEPYKRGEGREERTVKKSKREAAR